MYLSNFLHKELYSIQFGEKNSVLEKTEQQLNTLSLFPEMCNFMIPIGGKIARVAFKFCVLIFLEIKF